MDKHLHIVTLDIPYPADYGGAIEQFYKIVALFECGIKIHLHCFTKERAQQKELDKYCVSVNYYPRKKWSGISFTIPYIVNSRKCRQLIETLRQDNYPVLLEGIHCSYFLYSGDLNNRKVLLRLHNAEFEYYHQLALHEKDPFRKIYFKHESCLLKKYEKSLSEKVAIAAITEQDRQVYQSTFNSKNTFYLPAFIPFKSVIAQEGTGCYCLYHGNLSVNENEEAVIWLLENVFKDINVPFAIAGKMPSQRLEAIIKQYDHVCIVANPGEKELQDIIAKAQINILPSFNNTGIKFKLLNALYNGRHCITNKAGVEGTNLEQLCCIADSAEAIKSAINNLYTSTFTEEGKNKRQQILSSTYNNHQNAGKIIDFFWE